MRALIQRVSEASVTIQGQAFSKIGPGWLVLLGVGAGDVESDVQYLAQKIVNLRAFTDEFGKMNLSVKDIQGEVLVVSQFTLFGDTQKGRRPSFSGAATPDLARKLYLLFIDKVREENIIVATGEFQATMQVALINDGPVTFWLESE